jgi:hypothetical protein
MDKIKAFIESWYHRLQGHMLVTIVEPGRYNTSFWARDVYTEGGRLYADPIEENTIPYIILPTQSVTITGA